LGALIKKPVVSALVNSLFLFFAAITKDSRHAFCVYYLFTISPLQVVSCRLLQGWLPVVSLACGSFGQVRNSRLSSLPLGTLLCSLRFRLALSPTGRARQPGAARRTPVSEAPWDSETPQAPTVPNRAECKAEERWRSSAALSDDNAAGCAIPCCWARSH